MFHLKLATMAFFILICFVGGCSRGSYLGLKMRKAFLFPHISTTSSDWRGISIEGAFVAYENKSTGSIALVMLTNEKGGALKAWQFARHLPVRFGSSEILSMEKHHYYGNEVIQIVFAVQEENFTFNLKSYTWVKEPFILDAVLISKQKHIKSDLLFFDRLTKKALRSSLE